VAALLTASLALAHGGLEHVLGTVAKLSPTSITVTTAAGKTVEVALDEKTTFANAGKAVGFADIKVGDRVVIHAAKDHDKLIARTVEKGSAPAAK